MFPLSLHNYFEIAALLCSLIFWARIRNTPLRWITPYLFFIVAIELVGRYVGRELKQQNYFLYNLSVPVEYLFYSSLFFCYYQSKIFKGIAMSFIFLFPLFAVINFFIIEGQLRFNVNFLKVGSFFMIVFCCLYFFDLLTAARIVNPFTLTFFWIATGLFLFNVGEFVYNMFSDYFLKNWEEGLVIFRKINNVLIYVLYGSMIFGFIFGNGKRH